jgi:hypothetical protein
MAGYNGSIFAYGQTGSGKTHTVMGVLDSKELVRGRRGGASGRMQAAQTLAACRLRFSMCDAAMSSLACQQQRWLHSTAVERLWLYPGHHALALPPVMPDASMLCSCAPTEGPGPPRV